MKHCIKQADLGRRNLKHRRNMDKQITSMITVAGEYCAFFFPEELSQLESDQTPAEEGIPAFSLSVWCFLCPREQVSVNKGRKKSHSPSRWYLNQTGIVQEQRRGGRNLFLNPTWPRFDSFFPMFREPLKRPRLHRVQNLDLKLPHKSAQLDLCFWLQWRKNLIGSTDKEENGRFPSLFPPVLHMSLLEKRSYATKTFTNAWLRNLRLLTCDLLKGTRIWTCNGF